MQISVYLAQDKNISLCTALETARDCRQLQWDFTWKPSLLDMYSQWGDFRKTVL